MGVCIDNGNDVIKFGIVRLELDCRSWNAEERRLRSNHNLQYMTCRVPRSHRQRQTTSAQQYATLHALCDKN